MVSVQPKIFEFITRAPRDCSKCTIYKSHNARQFFSSTIIIFTICEFLTPVLIEDFSLKSESGFKTPLSIQADFKWCNLDGLDSTYGLQFP